MRRFIVIGLGNFGSTVARELHAQGHDVVALDLKGEPVDAIAEEVARAVVADGTHAETLSRIGAADADVGIVSTGSDVAASLLATLALKDVGVPEIVAKAVSVEHARILRRTGASETVFPERDSALDLAARMSNAMLLNYHLLGGGFSVQEMVVPEDWEGSTLRTLDLPHRYRVSVIGIHDVLTDRTEVPPDPDTVLKQSDTMIIAGSREALHGIARDR